MIFYLITAPAVFDETQLIMAGDQKGTYQALHCIILPYSGRGRAENTENTGALSKAWFGVWDTDIIPRAVFFINLSRKLTR